MAGDSTRRRFSPDDPDHVRELFACVSRRYDLLNTLISFGAHKRWRRCAASCAALKPGRAALDVCCGTGDMAFALAESSPDCVVVGVDFVLPMLDHFRSKVQSKPEGMAGRAFAVCGDALALPVRDGSFDAATIAFGLRNIPDRGLALAEMRRALKAGGRLVILDAGRPPGVAPRILFNLHFRLVVPLCGWVFTGRWGLYSYLPASLEKYPSREELADLLRDSGFVDVRWFDLAHGAATVHVGVKE